MIMEATAPYYKQKKEFHQFVAGSYPQLVKFREEGNQTAFNALLLRLTPEVKRYIRRRLTTAVSSGLLPKHKYRPDDFLDQLFIEVYDHFDEVKEDRDLHPWLFRKADLLLADTLTEEEFDIYFFENIADYSKAEWDEMEEKFTADGDGDLIMMEELDDISYPKHDYILRNVFLENESEELTARLDKEIRQENLRRHSEMVLQLLPARMRTAFELFAGHQFEVKEITQIMNLQMREVEQLLEGARKTLKNSFYSRYV